MHVACIVVNFINYKVDKLTNLKLYISKLPKFVQKSLRKKTKKTFLWITLICKKLSKIQQRKAKFLLEKIFARLESLYKRILDRILYQEDKNNIELYRQILCSITLAFRLLYLKSKISKSKLRHLVSYCDSFIRVRKKSTYLIY